MVQNGGDPALLFKACGWSGTKSHLDMLGDENEVYTNAASLADFEKMELEKKTSWGGITLLWGAWCYLFTSGFSCVVCVGVLRKALVVFSVSRKPS